MEHKETFMFYKILIIYLLCTAISNVAEKVRKIISGLFLITLMLELTN